jgi:hypothetical protein
MNYLLNLRKNKIAETEALEKESISRITKAQSEAEDTLKKSNDERITQIKEVN